MYNIIFLLRSYYKKYEGVLMKLGVSSCLLGEQCRYDGGHKRDKFLVDALSGYFEFIPFCPEAKVFGTPREPIRLILENESVHVKTVKGRVDVTKKLQETSCNMAMGIKKDELCGFVFKSKSPTCGVERVKVYEPNGMPSESGGVGLFVREIQKKFPLLPIEEEGRLSDAWLKENFLMQIFAYRDMFDFVAKSPNFDDLVKFHTAYKYLLYSKSHISYKKLGNIVANHEKKELDVVLEEYKTLFLEVIAQKGTIANTYNVLVHIYGYFKKLIDDEEKREVLQILEEFKGGIIPLIAVIKVLKLYAIRFNETYILNQKFLSPYPKELSLRSSIKAFK